MSRAKPGWSPALLPLGLVLALATLCGPAAPARAQEYEEYDIIVPDSTFDAQPRSPISYMTDYARDQARGTWTQNLGYSRSFRRFAVHASGGTSASEDLVAVGSKSTSGDFTGRLDWRATSRWVLSLEGRHAMSSITDGRRSSESEQRRNRLGIQSQYRLEPFRHARLFLLASSELQRNYDLRNTQRAIVGGTGQPESTFTQRDSAYFSGRQDGVRAQLDWSRGDRLSFSGKASLSRSRPTTDALRVQSRSANSGGSVTTTQDTSSVLPVDNVGLDGRLTLAPVRATTVRVTTQRTGIDQVYFDLGQLRVEQFSNDMVRHSLAVESAILPRTAITVVTSLKRSLREYVARPNLNALTTSREVNSTLGYSTPTTDAFINFVVNRTRADRQATGNGIILSRAMSASLSRRVLGRLYLVGIGNANLYSYRYNVATDDRDIASAFGSLGARYALTPRCSTALNMSVSRVHNVSIDPSRSSGNFQTTVYQANGSLRLPLHRNLSIGQDYVFSATYRTFDYDEDKDDLTRNWRIETIVVDTLVSFAFARLNHRYFFFDRGEFTPALEGGPRLYGIQQEQVQQTMDVTLGVRPTPGVTFLVRQSLADTNNRDMINETERATDQWNLSLGLEVARTFWGGAALNGAVRRESRYQNLSTSSRPENEEEHWLVAVSFQKDF